MGGPKVLRLLLPMVLAACGVAPGGGVADGGQGASDVVVFGRVDHSGGWTDAAGWRAEVADGAAADGAAAESRGPGDGMPLPDLVPGESLTEFLGPQDHQGEPGLPDLADPPDLPELPDLGTVDTGPCGLCPAERPACVDGQCQCTGTSCPAGHFCQGGKCVACVVDQHCGPKCESCSAQGKYCEAGGGWCVWCDSAHPCNDWYQCVDGDCVACEGLGLCGPSCVACPPTMPWCDQGVCRCQGQSCGAGAVCEAGACVACTDSDPLHCGANCLQCSGATPSCHQGQCMLCNKDDACGPTCQPCSGALSHCRPDGTGCVACLEDPDCPAGWKCTQFQCIEPCQAQGCATNLGPGGKKCSSAFVVGRVPAVAGFAHKGDTWNAGNDDDLNYFFGNNECWDANDDHFFRIYLMPQESIAVTLTPLEPYFDAMLKLYTGTECDKDSAGIFDDNDDYLVRCWNGASDGKAESFSYTAAAAGWYTVVVDGRMSDDLEEDFGAYSFSLKLTCAKQNCCCP